jgi:hypothetical protein
MDDLSPEVLGAVARIEALLAQAEPLMAGREGDEAAFSLREASRRYLPETLDAYRRIAPALRDDNARTALLAQLDHLERAVAAKLAILSDPGRTDLAANGAFLRERFGPASALPDAPAVEAPSTSALMMRRLFEPIDAARADATALLAAIAQRLGAAFGSLVSVKRSGPFGTGAIAAVTVEIPRETDTIRYTLARTQHGVEASGTRIVRAVPLRTQRVGVDEWLAALVEDLQAYLERERGSRETLTRLFGGP